MAENDDNNKNKGFTVSQLEGQAKKYATEIGLSVIFAVSAIFTLIWSGSMAFWSILLCMVFAIVGTLVPDYMIDGINKSIDFIYKEKVILIVIAAVLLLLAIFVPVIIFMLTGLLAGGFISSSMKRKAANSPLFSNEEEHSNESNEEDSQ